MTFFDSIILGALEGLTEFLPVSSTGHLILASSILSLSQTEFLKTFEIVIQLGSILAVVVLFWKKFLDVSTMKRILVAFLPTALIGLTLYHFIKTHLIGNAWLTVMMLALGGAIIIAIERGAGKEQPEKPIASLSYRQSLLIGLAQSLAIIPGVSRSGATVMGGLLMGLPRATILEFSFLLAVPTMLAASGLDLIKNPQALMGADGMLLAVGFSTAFFVALLTIKTVMGYVKRHSFAPFGWYRIVIALLFWLIVL